MKLKTQITAASIALALCAGTAQSYAHDEKAGQSKDPMTESLKPLKAKEFEVAFLQEMIHHHHSAVEMAELVASHTKRPELNQMAKQITGSQNSEIEQMTAWVKSWHNETPGSVEQMPGMEMMMKEMESLKQAKDAEFDRMFLDMMTPHHQGAVSMSKLVAERSERPELRKLAQQIIKDQTKEIAQMKQWQKAWFGN